jgi:hypothetical protein
VHPGGITAMRRWNRTTEDSLLEKREAIRPIEVRERM